MFASKQRGTVIAKGGSVTAEGLVEVPTYTVAKDLSGKESLREIIDALRADNSKLLRLLITGFVSNGRPQPKELTEALARHSILRNWLSGTECLDGNQNEVRQGQNMPEVTNIKARHKRGRRAKRKK